MFDADALRLVEQAYRFRYPLSFWQRREELITLAASERFREVYPGVRLVGTHDDIWEARQADPDLPFDLIPFMIVENPSFRDYYGFQAPRRAVAETAELPVLVWAIHAYVHGWEAGFGAFLDELQAEVAGEGTSS